MMNDLSVNLTQFMTLFLVQNFGGILSTLICFYYFDIYCWIEEQAQPNYFFQIRLEPITPIQKKTIKLSNAIYLTPSSIECCLFICPK